ncbi:hypothetical protein EJ02DRAFT_452921 [Clathrospora elynae]|uniref:MAGE domain-containing protein n=1 Tax=Clathrospora elynae TaxID=706981 RepID=A0A6A5T482_9PLEO|nr:hypothetical protein EJ02DRAFT_452921 [Clathrospora elynae]
MPSALDRLLASPALRLLRAPELPTACSTATRCCRPVTVRRHYGDDRKRPSKREGRRWEYQQKAIVNREHVLQSLGSEDAPAKHLFENAVIRVAKPADAAAQWAQWAVTLAQHERLNGPLGVRRVWNEGQMRGYRLPTDETPDAEFLWGTFIKHHLLVLKVIEHAARLLHETGKTYPRLYDLVMSYWLPRRPEQALKFHHLLLVKLGLKKLPLQALARSGRSTFKSPAYEALMDMYRNSNERDLYDDVVPVLIERGDLAMARRWHALCTFRNDVPSESVASHPIVQMFTVETSTMSKTDLHFDTISTSTKPMRVTARYNQELMRRLLGRDTAPVRFEDSFCARMFATRTFPPASIIQGLAMVGVNEIGPQAVLTMAARTKPVGELPRRFEELRAAGIALQGCVFSLALEKFAMEQKWHLVRSMIDSDQHPDVFGEADVQRRLLEYYLDKEDYVQAQRTLAILTLFHNDSSQASWNLLLQVYIKRTGPQHVMEVLRDMRTRRVMLTLESILAIKALLPRRQIGRKPTQRGKFDDLRFVARVFMTILENGMCAISPLSWREIIRRFGMLGRFRELRRLMLWLLCWYAPRGSLQFAGLPKSPFLVSALQKMRAAHPERNHYFHFPAMVLQRDNPLHPIRQLFKPSFQQALIIWGFKAGLLPNAPLERSLFGSTLAKKHYRRRLLQRRVLSRLDWSIGLRTLVQLRDLGVYVHHHTVLKALQAQFVVMFGRGRSNKKENRVMEVVNTLPYARYVHEANKIWGSPLLLEPQHFGKGVLYNDIWHPRLRRKINRRTSISPGVILGPNWRVRISEDDDESGGKAAEKDLLEQLEKHFAKQAKAMHPGMQTGSDKSSSEGTRLKK